MNFDSFGNLWMGAASIGLVKYENRAILKSYSHTQGDLTTLSPGWVSHIIESSDGKIWITTSDQTGGLNVHGSGNEVYSELSLSERILPGIWGLTE